MGDVLKDAGYSQTLLIGSEAAFGGRKLYFTEHGDFDIIDYTYASESGMIPEDYRVWWGFEDQKLFAFAKERLLELSEKDEPFNLTMLTVDTHFEDGYVCELCSNDFENDQYANVLACSDKQVKEFVRWVQEQPFYKNTTIVISGDHPTMDSDFCEEVDEEYIRKVYTSYIHSATEPEINTERNYTTFDNFPTTLASTGIVIEGNRLGLGTNLFSAEQTLTEQYGIDLTESELKKGSGFMEQLASLDMNTKELIYREGRVPAADIEVDAYQSEAGVLPVKVSNIVNMQEEVRMVLLAIWTNDDQSDLQWVQMESDE